MTKSVMYMVYEENYIEGHYLVHTPICVCATVARAKELVKEYSAASKKSVELTKIYDEWKMNYYKEHPEMNTSCEMREEHMKLIREKNKIMNNVAKVNRTQEMLDRVAEIDKIIQAENDRQVDLFDQFEKASKEYINTFPENERKLILTTYHCPEVNEYGYEKIEVR